MASEDTISKDNTLKAPVLIIGVSSRALFDLEDANRVFEEQGKTAYEQYQKEHENDILGKSVAFSLVSKLLKLNSDSVFAGGKPPVEVVVMSKNSTSTGIRVLKAIKKYGLGICKFAFTSGHPIAPYLNAFGVNLFLSANATDVGQALKANIPAGLVWTGGAGNAANGSEAFPDEVRIAFDGDAVLFSGESEEAFQKGGLQYFNDNEAAKADVPLAKGPLAPFFEAIGIIQGLYGDKDCPLRTALVTSRGAPAHMRVINTLSQYSGRIDEVFFLNGMGKGQVLEAFGADIFFDDQVKHVSQAAPYVSAAQVPMDVEIV